MLNLEWLSVLSNLCVPACAENDSPAAISMAGVVSPVFVSPTPVASPSQLYKSHSDYNMQRVSILIVQYQGRIKRRGHATVHKQTLYGRRNDTKYS